MKVQKKYIKFLCAFYFNLSLELRNISLSYALKSWSVMWYGKRRNRTRSLEALRLPVTERVVWGVLEWQFINYRSKTYLASREIDVLDMIRDFTEECTPWTLICNQVHEEREGVDTMPELSVGWPDSHGCMCIVYVSLETWVTSLNLDLLIRT